MQITTAGFTSWVDICCLQVRSHSASNLLTSIVFTFPYLMLMRPILTKYCFEDFLTFFFNCCQKTYMRKDAYFFFTMVFSHVCYLCEANKRNLSMVFMVSTNLFLAAISIATRVLLHYDIGLHKIFSMSCFRQSAYGTLIILTTVKKE